MATLRAHGIEAPLPGGFEGRIFMRSSNGFETPFPVAHFATFSLPDEVGDFGGGAVTLMGAADIFTTLFEYGPESLGTRLFARLGMPRMLSTDSFQPYVLRRGLGGQSGTQWFFTEAGRPFTLYVVLGSHARRSSLVPRVNSLLANLAISPPPQPSVPIGARWN
ncbi:MAG TPA: hypothetical protein VFC03_11810 [Acidimicrobiales bacterium]|nr:hypothetical protein [Acidimicrobiales bacterium]